MSQYYQDIDHPHLDYGLVRLQGSYLSVRGPAVDTSRPYLVCVGAAQTFGRFCTRPFPSLLAERLGIQVMNLSDGGVGPGWIENPRLLELLNGACMVVVQVLSARSEGNSMFDNSKSGGHMGIRARDGQRMTFIEFFKDLVEKESSATVERIVRETRANYVERTQRVLSRIRAPKALLWFSTRAPDYRDRPGTPFGYLSDFPHFVNRSMMETLRAGADRYVECVSRVGLPQPLWRATAPIEGAVLAGERLENRYYPSPEMHVAAADLLEPVCRELLLRADGVPVSEPAPVPFLVVSAGRTGSNLLRSLIDSHPNAFCGGEVFNKDYVDRKGIPWPIGKVQDDPELRRLMRDNPRGYIDRLFDVAAAVGKRAIGAKLTYEDGAAHPAASEQLAADTGIRVIHLRRRNVLRQYVSLQRAFQTGKWAADGNSEPLPKVTIDFVKFVWFLLRNEELQNTAEKLFASHPTMHVTYEDLAANPTTVGARCVEFLGLDPQVPLKTMHKKSATDSLHEAIENYDEVKARFAEWHGFFDE